VSVAIIGAGGFIGRHLAAALERRSIAVMRVSSGTGTTFDRTTGVLTADLPASPDLDAVVFLSQSPKYRNAPAQADHLWGVNIVSAIKAAEWARCSGATRFIYASSGTVYAPSFQAHRETDPLRRDRWYALSKVHAEESLRLFKDDLALTNARFFSVYGPGQEGKLIPNLIEAVRTGRPVQLEPHPADKNDVDGLRLSMTYVDDAIGVLMHLLTSGGPEVVNIAGPDVISIRHIAETIGKALAVKPCYATAFEPREGDAIADGSLLNSLWPGSFTRFADGLALTIEQSKTVR